jgi:hypothetical protein
LRPEPAHEVEQVRAPLHRDLVAAAHAAEHVQLMLHELPQLAVLVAVPGRRSAERSELRLEPLELPRARVVRERGQVAVELLDRPVQPVRGARRLATHLPRFRGQQAHDLADGPVVVGR